MMAMNSSWLTVRKNRQKWIDTKIKFGAISHENREAVLFSDGIATKFYGKV